MSVDVSLNRVVSFLVTLGEEDVTKKAKVTADDISNPYTIRLKGDGLYLIEVDLIGI